MLLLGENRPIYNKGSCFGHDGASPVDPARIPGKLHPVLQITVHI